MSGQPEFAELSDVRSRSIKITKTRMLESKVLWSKARKSTKLLR